MLSRGLDGTSTISGCFGSCVKSRYSASAYRHFVHTTDSRHPYPIYPNLVNGTTPDAPDVIWVADLTYIRLQSEFVYLATILDAYSRRCVGWNLSTRMDTSLTLGALEEALATREVSTGLIHHSDRGMQYARYAYTERLQSLGMQISMSAKGNAYDNAKAESFFKTLRTGGGVSQTVSHI